MKTRNFLVAVGVAALCLLLLPLPGQADYYDLTTLGATATINGAYFQQTSQKPAGSGVLDSFVRINTNDPEEEGFNTSARPVGYQENTSPTFTHDLLLGDVPIKPCDGTSCYEFVLDINQQDSDPFLSLDSILVFQGNALAPDALDGGIPSNMLDDGGPLGDLIYDLGMNWIGLNYTLETGSGDADMYMYIPVSAFDGTGTYVTLYSHFGGQGGDWINNDGFEEWATEEQVAVPDASVMLLLGSCLLGFTIFNRKRKTS